MVPDGFERFVLTFNGTIPGPTLSADWGDTFIVHVTNHLAENGTTTHFHGMRQLNNTQYDGVVSHLSLKACTVFRRLCCLLQWISTISRI